MARKIAIIGAGSVAFTRTLVRDILGVPEMQDFDIDLMDIDRRNLDMVHQILNRMLKGNGLTTRITATTDRRKALKDARYVIVCIRVGGLEAFRHDVEIPLGYGVDQCVGDTLGPGGVLYGQRGIPVILDICREIKELSEPGARMLNYANPNAMITWAANTYGGVPTIGLCHGVQGGHRQIAEVIALLVNKGKKPGEKGYTAVTKNDVDIVCAGINHQTWFIRALYKGEDWAGKLLPGFLAHPVLSKEEKVRIDMIRRFGYYSTESNGHLSEYLPWYRKRPSEFHKWFDLGKWHNGETAGYLRMCMESRTWFNTDFPNWMKAEAPRIGPAHRSHEHGSYILEGLETGRVYRGHFNVVNGHTIANLPPDCVIEGPGYVDKNGLSMTPVGDLPDGAAAVCNASISVQRLAVKAAVSGDETLLRQAVLMDPLTSAVCTPPEVWQMVDDLLVAQAKWLPQYGPAIRAARLRRRTEPRLPVKKNQGMKRLKVRSAAELAKDRVAATANVQATQK